MSDPVWVDEMAVIRANGRVLEQFGSGSEDVVLLVPLDSVLNRPQMAYHYRDPKPDIIELAAIYVHAICKAHAFLHANKRTAFHVCVLFLARNGYDFTPPKDETVELFTRLADDKHTGITEADVTAWVRKYAKAVLAPVDKPA